MRELRFLVKYWATATGDLAKACFFDDEEGVDVDVVMMNGFYVFSL